MFNHAVFSVRKNKNFTSGHSLPIPAPRFIFKLLFAVLCGSIDRSECDAQDRLAPVLLGEYTIHVDHTTKPGSGFSSMPINLHKGFVDASENATIDWAPFEFLKETQLQSLQDDSAKPLSIGEDSTSDLVLVVSSLERIRPGEIRSLNLEIPHPESLTPGIYQGKILFRFSAPDFELFGYVQVSLSVRGRRLFHLGFSHAKDGKVQFGKPADIEVQIDTIDAELGRGSLGFSNQPNAAPAPQQLTPLSVPFPPEELFIDPNSLPRSTYPQSWSKTAFWTESDVPPKNPNPSYPQWKRYSVTLHLGDCDDLGKIACKVKWPQDDHAPGVGSKIEEKEAQATVVEGISIQPRIAFAGEKITLTLASMTDLGDQVDIMLIKESIEQGGEKVYKIPLERIGREKIKPDTGKPEAQARTIGQPFLYINKGEYRPRNLATYALRFTDETIQKFPSLKVLNEAGNTVNVWLQDRGQRNPLRVFASSPPFWWDLISDKEKGSGWTEKRDDMWNIEFDMKRIRDVSVTMFALPRRPISAIPKNTDPDLEPRFQVTGGSADTENSSSNQRWEAVSSPLILHGEASLNHDVVLKKNPVIGVWKFPFRMSIAGTSNDQRIVRIFEPTATVEVTTQWVYYNGLIVWLVGAAAFGGLLRWMYRRANPKSRKGNSEANSRKTGSGSQTDEFGDFLTTSPSESISSLPSANVPDQILKPPPPSSRDDDLDDFMNSR